MWWLETNKQNRQTQENIFRFKRGEGKEKEGNVCVFVYIAEQTSYHVQLLPDFIKPKNSLFSRR